MTADIKLKLDFRNKVPISDQVQNEMRRLVEEGFLHPGDQLPTVRVLAAQLKVNFNTIARAYRMLDQEGLISTQQGRGTYVVDAESNTEAQEQGMPASPVLTKEEWAEQLITGLLEKANRLDISSELLFQAFLEHIEKQPEQKIGPKKARPNRRILRKSQKKFVYIPVGIRGWVKSKSGRRLKKPRKIRISKQSVYDSVSRETKS